MCFEAAFVAAAVRYTSVGAEFRGPSGAQTVAEPATDGHGQAYGQARTNPRTTAEEATDGAGGSGYTDRPHGFLPLSWHFRFLDRCRCKGRDAVACAASVRVGTSEFRWAARDAGIEVGRAEPALAGDARRL